MPYLTSQHDQTTQQFQELARFFRGYLTGTAASFSSEPANLAHLIVENRLASLFEMVANDEQYWNQLASSTQNTIHKEVVNNAVSQMIHQNHMKRFLTVLNNYDLNALVIKGHAVGPTIYPSRDNRPTSDLDIIMPIEQVKKAEHALISEGYQCQETDKGRLISAARNWTEEIPSASIPFNIDIHWDVSNRLYFRNRLSFSELMQNAISVNENGLSYQIPSHINSLIIACLHLAAMDEDYTIHLIWLFDIYLLMNKLTEQDVEIFIQQCKAKKLTEACESYCTQAINLAPTARLTQIAKRLKAHSNPLRKIIYNNTLRYRVFDLIVATIRQQDMKNRLQFLKEFASHIKTRKQ